MFLGQDFRHRNQHNGQSGFLRDFKKLPEDSIDNKENDPYYQFQQYKVYKQKQENERRHERLAAMPGASYASSSNDVKGDR